jgi:predicted transcriptional regulator
VQIAGHVLPVPALEPATSPERVNCAVMSAAKTAKQRVREIVEGQPADSSYDEILQELAFTRMIDRGLADVDAGHTTSHEDVKRRIASWAVSGGPTKPSAG